MASLDSNNADKPVAAEEEQLVINVTKILEPNPSKDEQEKTKEDEADSSKGVQTTNDVNKSSHDGNHTAITENSNDDKITDPQGNQKHRQGKIKFIDDLIQKIVLNAGTSRISMLPY